MEEEYNIQKINSKKLDFFLKNNIKIHITKLNREFIRGYLTKKLSDSMYKLKEDKTGKEVYLFLEEIFDVNQWLPNKHKKEVRRENG